MGLKEYTNKKMANLQDSGIFMPLVFILGLILMFGICLIVFFSAVKGEEKVLVPNVTGKTLENALLEMQVRELYPKIQLRYTDNPDDAGTILSQNPQGGAVVKAGRRIDLIVSRGVILDVVENYIGKNYESEKIRLQALFAGSNKPLITFAEPTYKSDMSEAGTIIAQDPKEGTELSSPVAVRLVVSRGPNFEQTKVPNLIGLSVNDLLATMARSNLVFEFSAHIASGDERPGTVVSQQSSDSDFLPNYSRFKAELALPSGRSSDDGNTVFGIFEYQAQNYPYPVSMQLDALTKDGSTYSIVKLNHTGGNITIPYAVPAGTELTLKIVNKEVQTIVVN